MNKIMVVEDDVYLSEEIVTTFTKKGYSVSSISSFNAPELEIIEAKPDLIILDLNLPGKSGFELCKIIKNRTSYPILILTACDTLSDELKALGLGADDFLTKPCHPERLIAHAVRLLETYKKMRIIVRAGELVLDTETFKVMFGSSSVFLPENEGKILRVLIERHPDIVPQQELFQLLWGGNNYIDENILQVNMTRLRKKLNDGGIDDIVRTERGKGYYLGVND